MLDPDAIRGTTVEWRPARAEDAAIWVSVTRRSADQVTFEAEDAQIARYKEENPDLQAQRYLLWRDEAPVGRLRFFAYGNTAELDGLVLLPEAGGSVAAQVVSEALVRSAALDVRHLKATYSAAYIASFAGAGFQELRRRTGMTASTDLMVPLFPLPASLRVREMLPDDGEQVGILLQRAYAGGPDSLHPDVAGWRAEVRAIQEGRFGPFIPESCFVVEHSLDRYNLVGAILVHLEHGVPRIRHMVVAPAFRHVGLGQFLAVKSMRRLHDLDYATALLYVTLGIPAVNLYHRLGFIETGPTYIEAERMLLK
ncbi:N-acetyltransferase [Ktedonosporobacter rubrisoli]|uniref:N-acetyltransferase n=1 Tax=Ktedonosporobacter rubrisoli TaxID=2509675 RepID=A0A4P6K2H9_KTERU|nr:GNAT family N-acetyltransferase [Ktedonosporobacter rubrisoli]QBD82112.1 N-acetyltransferase [Ktedonosporobacter rubrisoli]